MDTQPTPPNSPGPAERQPAVNPEDLTSAPREMPAPHESSPSGSPVADTPPAQAAASKPATPLSANDVAAVIAAVPGATSGAAQGPTVAGDVDVIEPEWVDKAEDAIRAHQGDPHGEEEAIEELQEDYLQKRYGIHVANPNPDDTKPKGA